MIDKHNIIEQLRCLLSKLLTKGEAVFLFGSQARGDSSADSDWDLLILLNRHDSLSVSDRGELALPIYELGANIGIDINPVIYSQRDWKKRSFTEFYKNVSSEGVQIWG